MELIKEIVTKYKTSDGVIFSNSEAARNHEKNIPYEKYYVELDNCLEFEVTEKHLLLMKRNEIEWVFDKDTFNGHFYQDTVRPYGNSNWIWDIGEILGIEPDMHSRKDPEDKWYSDSLVFYLVKFHMDMKICMQIVCRNLSIVPGKYKRSASYDSDWKLVEPTSSKYTKQSVHELISKDDNFVNNGSLMALSNILTKCGFLSESIRLDAPCGLDKNYKATIKSDVIPSIKLKSLKMDDLRGKIRSYLKEELVKINPEQFEPKDGLEGFSEKYGKNKEE